MRYIIVLCLACLVTGFPQDRERRPEPEYRSNPDDVNAEIIRSDLAHGPEHGQFQYGFQTSNGIEEEREGNLLDEGGQHKEGYFLIPLEDGQQARFDYTAGLGGYVVHSDFLHPMPPHAIEQIRMAEELRAQGVEWDERGFRI